MHRKFTRLTHGGLTGGDDVLKSTSRVSHMFGDDIAT
jgi:hypothetical protein